MFELVMNYCRLIKNGRTKHTIFAHLESEVVELNDEINAEVPGDDGIIGESIDIILCAIDQIHQENPNITEAEIIEIARRKCDKWVQKYS